MAVEKVIIIGSGPAGHSAAIYAGRARLEPLMFEGLYAGGVAAGGQLTTTTEVENYAGFPAGITGPALMESMRHQSLHCGTTILTETVDRVDLKVNPYKVFVGEKVHECHAVIVCTGATAKRLGLPHEEVFWQKGISACAICDGALPIYRGKPLGVIGGGDSACEEALFLTKYAEKVYLIHRRDRLRASKVMQERVLNHTKIEMVWNFQAVDVRGEGEKALGSVLLRHVKDNATKELFIKGLFYAVGHKPNTTFLEGQLDLDAEGYLLTQAGTTKTSQQGVFAAGDVQDKQYRQAITSAGTGCMAALDAERFLAEHHYL